MDEPGLAFHFAFELAATPTRIAREATDLPGGGEGFGEFLEVVERLAHAEVGENVAFGQERIGVEVCKGCGLDWTTEVDLLLFDLVGEIGDKDVPHFVFSGLVEDKAEGAFGIVMTDKDD